MLAGMRVHHVAIQVADLETCARFYREVLGLEAVEAAREGVAWFKLGDALLMLEPVDGAVLADPFTTDRPGIHLLAIAIGPNEHVAWEERLQRANEQIEQRTAFTIYLRDPEGNRIALSSWPEPAELRP
jgi:catechol-2,3-dioxygenase